MTDYATYPAEVMTVAHDAAVIGTSPQIDVQRKGLVGL